MYRRRDPNYKFKRGYLLLLGFGLMLFGVFAIYFPAYDHPIYGRIDFGGYHVPIGCGSIVLSVAVMLLIKRKY